MTDKPLLPSSTMRSIILLFAAIALIAGFVSPAETVVGAEDSAEFYTNVYGRETSDVCELPFEPYTGERDSLPAPIVIPPDQLARMPRTANISVNYSGSWTNQARVSFEYAVSIWERLITSPVTILVDAEWANLGNGVLGGAGPIQYARNFPGAPLGNTWYPIALANSLTGSDLHGSSDIRSRFNSSFDWYFGTDANPPFSQVDFVSVVLHELGHGLGFAGSFQANDSIAQWGFSGTPDIYDRFVENGSGTSIISGFGNSSSALRAQLTSNAIFFDGNNSNAANGGSRAKLHAPSTWSQGSSISHLDNVFNGTENALMTFSISNGVAEHTPGPVTLGLFADMGWQISNPLAFYDGAFMLEAGTAANNAIDLWAFADDDSPDSALRFSIVGGTASGISATLDNNRYLDVTATAIGTLDVEVQVIDPSQNSQTATFKIISVSTVKGVYLPTTSK